MIIDAHVHVGRWHQPWRSGDATADLVTTAVECGIDKLLVSSLGNSGYTFYPTPEQLREANDHVLEELERFPGILYGFCYASPEHARESLDEIRRCVRDGPMVGIKLWIARKATEPGVDVLLEEAARLGVPVLQHAWLKTTGNYEHESTPADVAEAGRRHPETILQMAHLYGAGERGLHDIAPYPNVLVDTSGGDPEAGLLEYATTLLGADRIVFGSDAPGRDFSVPLGKVIGADLTPEQKALIFAGNAARIYRLEG